MMSRRHTGEPASRSTSLHVAPPAQPPGWAGWEQPHTCHETANPPSLRAAAAHTLSVAPGVPEALLPVCLRLPTPRNLMYTILP